MSLSFDGLAIVAAVAFAAPLALGLVPGLRLPVVVLEMLLGIAIGPDVLGWACSQGSRSSSRCSRADSYA